MTLPPAGFTGYEGAPYISGAPRGPAAVATAADDGAATIRLLVTSDSLSVNEAVDCVIDRQTFVLDFAREFVRWMAEDWRADQYGGVPSSADVATREGLYLKRLDFRVLLTGRDRRRWAAGTPRQMGNGLGPGHPAT